MKQEKLTWDYVRDRVSAEFERKKSEKQQLQPNTKSPHDALFTSGGKGGGSKFSKNENNNNNSFERKTKFKCHYCKETGHFIKDCEKRKAKEEREKQKEETATFCRSEVGKFCPEFALHVDDINKKLKARWLLDSACSKHMTGEKDDLVDYEEFNKDNFDESQYVTLADKTVVRAAGQGKLNVHLRDVDGRIVPVTFENVLYVPNLERLISISQLTRRGAEVLFKENSVELRLGERKFQFGTKIGKLFKMNWCFFADVSSKGCEVTCTETKCRSVVVVVITCFPWVRSM